MRALARFFVEGVHAAGDSVALDRSDARKVRTVLRLRSGDAIEIVDSSGASFRATITLANGSVQAQLLERDATVTSSLLHITVAQSVPKGQKMDFVIEKLVELGAASIVPLHSERTISHATSPKLARWRRLAKAAAIQSGSSTIPPVADPVKMLELIASFDRFDRVLFAWECAPRVPLRRHLQDLGSHERILAVIGPEGGFTHAEAEAAEHAGAWMVWLGIRVLRTETAALALTAILHYVAEQQTQ